jgi:hypothetical protein
MVSCSNNQSDEENERDGIEGKVMERVRLERKGIFFF